MMKLVFLLLLCPFHTIAVEPIVAKPGCHDRCGNVSIPYPFGMGTNCSIDAWFQIDCKHNGSKPFLKKLNLEVLEILQPERGNPGLIRVDNPVSSSYCNRSGPGAGGDLTENNRGSPYSSCVAAVMEWGLPNSSAEAVALFQEGQRSMSFTCYNLPWKIQCYCYEGYDGTAYFQNSCQDIDECKDHPNICSESKNDHNCVNQIGYYRCVNKRFDRIMDAVLNTGASIVGLLLLILICSSLKALRTDRKLETKRKKYFFKRNGGLLLEQQLSSSQDNAERTKVFTSKELKAATNRFNKNKILVDGGQGTVYKGKLPNGRTVAVKKSKIENLTIVGQFINEMVILSRINHRNIVKLLGCCLETDVPLLVYEYVPNGTLSQYLHGQVEDFVLSWEMRLQIATEVAGALSYLHSAASIPIYHRDIKSSNILLDDKYQAKVADFGISRSVAIEQTHLSTFPNGTFGYFDPECFHLRRFTEKSDVFSFGVVLVELLTGLKAVFTLEDEEPTNLAIHFTKKMETGQLSDILDKEVAEQGEKHEVMEFANLAKICLEMEGRNRPRMLEVMMELERINKLHKATTGSGEAHHEDVLYVSSSEVESWEGISRTESGEAHDEDIVEEEPREGTSKLDDTSTDNGKAHDEDMAYVSSPEEEPLEGTSKLDNTSTDHGKARDEDDQHKNSHVFSGPCELEKFLFFS